MKTTLRWVVLGHSRTTVMYRPACHSVGRRCGRSWRALLAARGPNRARRCDCRGALGRYSAPIAVHRRACDCQHRPASVGADRVESCPGGYRLALGDHQLDVARAATCSCWAGSHSPTATPPRRRRASTKRSPSGTGRPARPHGLRVPPGDHSAWVELRLDLLEVGTTPTSPSAGTPRSRSIASEQVVERPVAWRDSAVQQVLALYRSSRQAEALGACDEHHRRLAEELGIAPCPELADLQLRILRQDPRLLLDNVHGASSVVRLSPTNRLRSGAPRWNPSSRPSTTISTTCCARRAGPRPCRSSWIGCAAPIASSVAVAMLAASVVLVLAGDRVAIPPRPGVAADGLGRHGSAPAGGASTVASGPTTSTTVARPADRPRWPVQSPTRAWSRCRPASDRRTRSSRPAEPPGPPTSSV